MTTQTRTQDTLYAYWRRHIMLGMYVGYAGFYLTRKTLSAASPALITNLNIDMAHIGLMGTLFSLTYGVSKFVSGMIADQTNSRFFMSTGLILTGVISLVFSQMHSIAALTALWVANAWFQGWGWPACANLLTSWYSRNERGVWWAVWNTAHNVGGAIVPVLVAYLVIHVNWQAGFALPGVAAIVIGLLLFFYLRDKPKSLGLPNIGDWRKDKLEQFHEADSPSLTYRTILHRYVLTNRYLWLLAVSYIMVYIVRTAIYDWGNIYLTQQHHYSLIQANIALAMFEVGGVLGSLVAGWGSDRIFAGNRGPMCILFATGIFLSVAAFWLFPFTDIFIHALLLFCVGFFVFGPQMLIGMAAAECSHKQAAGASTGFVGIFAYLGAAAAGYPLALIIEAFSWQGFFIAIALCAVTIGLVLLPFLRMQVDTSEEK